MPSSYEGIAGSLCCQLGTNNQTSCTAYLGTGALTAQSRVYGGSATIDAVGKIKIATSRPAGGRSGVSYAARASSLEGPGLKTRKGYFYAGPSHQAARHKTVMTMLSGVPGSLVFLGDESRAGLSAL